MARIDVPDGSGLERERLLMMQLDVAMGMGAYSAAIYEDLASAWVRVAASHRRCNGCPVCLNTRSAHATEDGFDEATVEAVVACDLGGVHTLGDLDERERLAGEFADRFASDHHRLDDTFMADLRDHFTDVEVIELTALCAMTLGNGRFFTVLGVEADDDGHYFVNEANGDARRAPATASSSPSMISGAKDHRSFSCTPPASMAVPPDRRATRRHSPLLGTGPSGPRRQPFRGRPLSLEWHGRRPLRRTRRSRHRRAGRLRRSLDGRRHHGRHRAPSARHDPHCVALRADRLPPMGDNPSTMSEVARNRRASFDTIEAVRRDTDPAHRFPRSTLRCSTTMSVTASRRRRRGSRQVRPERGPHVRKRRLRGLWAPRRYRCRHHRDCVDRWAPPATIAPMVAEESGRAPRHLGGRDPLRAVHPSGAAAARFGTTSDERAHTAEGSALRPRKSAPVVFARHSPVERSGDLPVRWGRPRCGHHCLEETTGRPVVWATAQYLDFAKVGETMDLDVHVSVSGRYTTQARVIGHVGDREIITVNAALGKRTRPAETWPTRRPFARCLSAPRVRLRPGFAREAPRPTVRPTTGEKLGGPTGHGPDGCASGPSRPTVSATAPQPWRCSALRPDGYLQRRVTAGRLEQPR